MKLYSVKDYFLLLFSFIFSYTIIWIAIIILLWWMSTYISKSSKLYGIFDILGGVSYFSIYLLLPMVWFYITYIYFKYEYIKIDKDEKVKLWNLDYSSLPKIPAYIYLYNSRLSWLAIEFKEIIHVDWITWMDYSTAMRAERSAHWVSSIIIVWTILILVWWIIGIFFFLGMVLKYLCNFFLKSNEELTNEYLWKK